MRYRWGVLWLMTLAILTEGTSTTSVPWNTTAFFGPDGPWQAVVVELGNDSSSTVNLYPGGVFAHNVMSSQVCYGITSCPARSAGLYDISASTTALHDFVSDEQSAGEWGSELASNETSTAETVIDQLSLRLSSGTYMIVPNTTISAISESEIHLPNGTSYQRQVGNLALGFASSSWPTLNNDTVVGYVLTGWFKGKGHLLSTSWGLQIGSVPHNLQGSLILGGYDRSRFTGAIGVYDTTIGPGATVGYPLVAPLIDIAIGVELGTSPFSPAEIHGFLDTSPGEPMQMNFNPALPYLYLPRKTCDKIAAQLPVTYRADINLYTWNIADPRYDSIITSPSQMMSTFEQPDTSNLTIKVPFAVLNLTLSPPLAPVPTPYFPCQPFEGARGMWFLGRAFLQAAYIAMNWDQNRAFLAQGLGPDVGPSFLETFQSDSVTMNSTSNDEYAGTWARTWKILNSSNRTPSTEAPQNPSSFLSVGASAGICIGIIIVLSTPVAVTCMARHARRAKTGSSAPNSENEESVHPSELGSNGVVSMIDTDSTPGEYWHASRTELRELGNGEVATEMDTSRDIRD